MITNIFRPFAACLFSSKHKLLIGSAVKQLRDEIANTRSLCRESTHKNKVTAVNTFERFLIETQQNAAVLSIDKVTPDHIKAFERWLLDQGYSPNYASLHMRCLRALLNRINGKGSQLFSCVRTSNCQTLKRAVSTYTIKRLNCMKLPMGTSIALARDIFLFCFYCMGMPLIDAVMLKKSQLINGCLSYRRQKTGRLVNIPISHGLTLLIERLSESSSSYLLPILTTDNRTEGYHQYKRFYQRYRRDLLKLGDMIEGNVHLTSYTARHTWASIVYQHGGSINAIAKALGHTNSNTTYSYIQDISDNELATANEIALKAIFSTL